MEKENKYLENKNGRISIGTTVNFEVENMDMWGGDTEGVLIFKNNEFAVKTKNNGILTIDKGYDIYFHTIRPKDGVIPSTPKECKHKTLICKTDGKPPVCSKCGIKYIEPTPKEVEEATDQVIKHYKPALVALGKDEPPVEDVIEGLEKIIEKYKKKNGYFDLIDGYIPLENFIKQEIKKAREEEQQYCELQKEHMNNIALEEEVEKAEKRLTIILQHTVEIKEIFKKLTK